MKSKPTNAKKKQTRRAKRVLDLYDLPMLSAPRESWIPIGAGCYSRSTHTPAS